MSRLYTFIRLAAVAIMLVLASCSTDDPVTTGIDDDDGTPGPSPSDTTPPVAVTDPEVSLAATGDTVLLTWTAPHDDTPDDPVHHYQIRFAFTRGFPPVAFWDLAPMVPNPPAPASPGSPQNYRFVYLEPGKDMWVGIASYDSAGNRSPGSDVVMVHVPGLELLGRCVDAFSGAPVAGLGVRVVSAHAQSFVTDATGTFRAGDLVRGATSVQIETGSAADEYHRVSEILDMVDDLSHTSVMVPVRPTTTPALGGMSLLRFFKMLTGTVDAPKILAKWHSYPVKVHIPPFVNGLGVDYEEVSKRAAQRWMDRTGKQLFTFVSAPPDTGIVVVYRSRASLAPLIGITYYVVVSDRHPIRDEIHIVDDADTNFVNVLYKVMVHEFGHTIGFGHINVNSLMMWQGQPLPPDISDDETNAAILHWAMPTRIDMGIYDEEYP
jgi:hypothetical protein